MLAGGINLIHVDIPKMETHEMEWKVCVRCLGDNLKEWNMFKICSCHLISICF